MSATLANCPCGLLFRCAFHGEMMKDIAAVYKGPDATEAILLAIYAQSDGYGEVGYVPDQGYDWSGIRDSSPAAVERMWAAARGVDA